LAQICNSWYKTVDAEGKEEKRGGEKNHERKRETGQMRGDRGRIKLNEKREKEKGVNRGGSKIT